MKIFEVYSVKTIMGLFRIQANNEEQELYDKIEKEKILVKDILDDYSKELAFKMCSKGLIRRLKNSKGAICYTINSLNNNLIRD